MKKNNKIIILPLFGLGAGLGDSDATSVPSSGINSISDSKKQALELSRLLKSVNDRERFFDTWNVLANILSCAIPELITGFRFPKTSLKRRLWRDLKGFIQRLFRWCLKTHTSKGNLWIKKRLKALGAVSRHRAMKDINPYVEKYRDGPFGAESIFLDRLLKFCPKTNEFLFLISTIKRSLAHPLKAEEEENLEKFFSIVGKVRSELTPTDYHEGFEFAGEYCKAFSPDFEAIHMPISSSASLNHPISKGGTFSYVRELYSSYGYHTVYDAFSERESIEQENVFGIFGDHKNFDYSMNASEMGYEVQEMDGDIHNLTFYSQKRKTVEFSTEYDRYFGIEKDQVFDYYKRSPDHLSISYFIFKDLIEKDLLLFEGEGFDERLPYGDRLNYEISLPDRPSYADLQKTNGDFEKIGEHLLDASVISVADAGSKARILCLVNPGLILLMHLARTYLFSSARKDRSCVLSNKTGKMMNTQKMLSSSVYHDEYYLSLDLTSATDTFDTMFCRTLYEGFVNKRIQMLDKNDLSSKKERLFCIFLLKMTNIFIPDWSFFQKNEQTKRYRFRTVGHCGIAMGTPISWTILNIYNRFFLSYALKRQENISFAASLKMSGFMFCGDDMAGALKLQTIRDYVKQLVKSGAIISDTNYVSKDVLTFTENFFVPVDSFNKKTKRKTKFLSVLSVPKLKAFRNKLASVRLPRLKTIPASWSRGTAASSQLIHSIKMPKCGINVTRALKLLVHWYQHKFINDLRKLGLPVFLTRHFGGMGYPVLKNSRESSQNLLLVSVLTQKDHSTRRYIQRRKASAIFSPVTYSPLGQMVGSVTDRLFNRIEKEGAIQSMVSINAIYGRETPSFPEYLENRYILWDEIDRYRQNGYVMANEMFDFMESFFWENFSSFYKRDDVSEPPSLSKVARRFKKFRDPLIRNVPPDRYKKPKLTYNLYDRIQYLDQTLMCDRDLCLRIFKEFVRELDASEDLIVFALDNVSRIVFPQNDHLFFISDEKKIKEVRYNNVTKTVEENSFSTCIVS